MTTPIDEPWSEPSGTASFGFKDVPIHDKTGMVREVFERVAGRYDLMNDVLSLGVHRVWKWAFADRINLQPGETLIDVAGGTGDIVRAVGDRRRKLPDQAAPRIVMVDINPAMLAQARTRGLPDEVEVAVGNAEQLSFADQSFDAYSIAFGIRNVTDMDAALREAYRVLKPGGRFLCLEFSDINVPAIAGLYERYSMNAIPILGQWIAGDRDAYQYLVESIRRFPNAEDFAGRLRQAGFGMVDYMRFSAGAAAVHRGWRI